MMGERAPGTVYLVGAGPGDPRLLTLRGAELLASAGAVVHDALVSPALLDHVSPDAEVRLVGDPGGSKSADADEVAGALRELAGRHRRVVRLAVGDPFLFGRGGREALALARAGVPVEVVPGVSAGVGVPAYAGIPLTHRGTASTVAFVPGREDCLGEESAERWAHLAAAADTLVVFMGRRRLGEIAERLIAGGRSPSTPAAVIERGSHPMQRTVEGTLRTIAEEARRAAVEAPSLVVIGEAVGLRAELAWFETRPLSGRRVVVTRPRPQAEEFSRALEELGAEVVAFPTIRIADPPDPEPLRRAAAGAGDFDWIVFTSVNGVERFWAALRAGGGDTRVLGGVSLCAIGPATAAAIEVEGARADLVPPEYVAEAVVEALAGACELRGARILLPRAEVASSVLPDSLRERGAEVHDVPAYRTEPDGEQAERVRAMLRRGEVDVVTFTASSTVRNFAELVGTDVGGARVACIGPITAATARELGLEVAIEADVYTVPGLLDAIVRHFAAGEDAP